MQRAVRRGQLALVGVLILAATLIALLYTYTLQPRAVLERGHLQAAQLVHAIRACMATGRCDTTKLDSVYLQRLRALNQTYPLRMYSTTCAVQNQANLNALTVTNTTTCSLATPAGTETLTVTVSSRALSVLRTYSKVVGERVYTMVEVELEYKHAYTSPWFNVALCPKVRSVGVADVRPLGGCRWKVGVPLELARRLQGQFYRYDLKDEFGAPVIVLFKP